MSDEQSRLRTVRARTARVGLPDAWDVGGLTARLAAGSAAADDCAVVDLAGSGSLVVTSDYVRGVKFALFDCGILSYYDLGWYLATANLSDVAAMGAQPVGLLTVVRYPAALSDDDFDGVMCGIADAAAQSGANPMGGDVGTAERLFLSATAFGITAAGGALRRDGARPGDLLAVTGPVGTPAAALVYFDRLKPEGRLLAAAVEEHLAGAWKHPQARVAEGLAVSAGGATACQDVSDGLRDTVAQLCAASGVGCRLQEAALPIEDPVTEVAAAAEIDATALALGASVDFELLLAVAPQDETRCRRELERAGGTMHVIGACTDDPRLLLERANGSSVLMPGASWSHQSDDPAGILVASSRRDSGR